MVIELREWSRMTEQLRRYYLCNAQTPESDGEESIPGEQSLERDVEILRSFFLESGGRPRLGSSCRHGFRLSPE